MSTPRRTLRGLLAVVTIALAACASPHSEHFVPLTQGPVPPLTSFVHRAASPEIELFWNCRRPGQGITRLEGAARNSGQREVRSVFLTVTAMQAGDRPLLETAATVPEVVLYRSGPSPFQVDLSLEKPPSRIDVSAEYRMTPTVNAPDSAGPQGTLTAEDACAPSKHPNPSYRH